MKITNTNGIVETPYGVFELSKFKELISDLSGNETFIAGHFKGEERIRALDPETMPQGTFDITISADCLVGS